MDIKVPDGYVASDDGIYKTGIASKRKIVNAIPNAAHWRKRVNRETGKEEEYVCVRFFRNGQLEEKVYPFELNAIRSGKFIEKLPVYVIIEPRCSKIVSEVFRWCIQNGLSGLPMEVEEEYPHGWNNKRFYFENGTEFMLKAGEYQIAVEAVFLILQRADPLIAIFLAGLHGPLEGMLHDAGLEHDFTTDIEGETGVGKTDLTRVIVNAVMGRTASLASDRKEVIKVIQDSADVTWVMDDYNKAESDRTKERVRQTVSEIIQAQCNSAPMLVEGCGGKTKHVHLVISREAKFKNPSTINRTYWVKMDEAFSAQVYEKMKQFGKESMLSFICYIIKFVETDYDEIKERVRGDYKLFQNEARKISPDNRIANTIAVQNVLKQIYVSYFKHIGIDDKIVETLNTVFTASINRVGCEMYTYIDSKRKEANSMLVLPMLAQVTMSIGNGYELAASEKKYNKNGVGSSGQKIIGFCANDGYISFNKDRMIELLEAENGKTISPTVFSKELRDYGLAHVDSEKKLSSYWHTKTRMYHINVRSLLTLCYPDDIFGDMIEVICNFFDRNA